MRSRLFPGFELRGSGQVDSAKSSPTTTLRKRFVLSQGNVNVEAASFKSSANFPFGRSQKTCDICSIHVGEAFLDLVKSKADMNLCKLTEVESAYSSGVIIC